MKPNKEFVDNPVKAHLLLSLRRDGRVSGANPHRGESQ